MILAGKAIPSAVSCTVHPGMSLRWFLKWGHCLVLAQLAQDAGQVELGLQIP